jgi:hypothetical protein
MVLRLLQSLSRLPFLERNPVGQQVRGNPDVALMLVVESLSAIYGPLCVRSVSFQAIARDPGLWCPLLVTL